MEWKMENGRPAPAAAVDVAEAASVTYRVPVGILLGTVECESDFRLGVVSSAGAVGPCQFQPKYAEDYYRYAGFRFDLTSWESIAGMAAIFVFYAKLGAERYGFAGGPGGHGAHFHRAPGSVGQCATPSRVFKGLRLPGHMGCDTVTVKNLEVVRIDEEQNLILVKGAVPGGKNGIVRVRMA